jgi:hypothetical protein
LSYTCAKQKGDISLENLEVGFFSGSERTK